MTVSADTISMLPTNSRYEEYTTLYLEKIAGKIVSVTGVETLYGCADEQPKANIYTFDEGYAIIDLKEFYVCEYSLEGDSPYALVSDQRKYYDGPMGYYVKDDEKFVHVISGSKSVASDTIANSSLSSLATMRSANEKIDLLKAYEPVMTMEITQENKLPRALSTAWVSGYCGTTSAHAMLKYRGYVESDKTATEVIYTIAASTGPGVTLSVLKNGINNYLNYIGNSKTVASMSYSFSKVVSEINAGRPLTLGTNGGGLATAGHVQTIHGYERTSIGVGAIEYYTLYVNNSWGKNNVAISYENTVPPYLKDHVYYTS